MRPPCERTRRLPAAGRTYSWIAILTFTTYLCPAFMREPGLRLHVPVAAHPGGCAADEMGDQRKPIGTTWEPRTSIKKADELRAMASACDCKSTATMRPRSVRPHRVRNGAQLESVLCCLCIDACEPFPWKRSSGPPPHRHDTDITSPGSPKERRPIYRIIRPRTLIYAGIIVLVGASCSTRC